MKGTKIIYLRRKIVAAVACVIAAAAMLYVVNSPMVVGAAATSRQLPIYCVQKDYKALSISFDAAWGNEDTQQLIDILAKYNVQATFFIVGEWVDKYPESVKALSDAGHEVMGHSNDHAHFNSLSTQEIIDDINANNDKIEGVTGVRPPLFRCPYGEYDDHVINAVRSMNIEPIQWDVDSLDWKDYGVETILSNVLNHKHLGNGSIILCHNGARHTAEALESLIDGLQEKGFTLVKMSDLIYKDNYEMDAEGRQHLIASPESPAATKETQ